MDVENIDRPPRGKVHADKAGLSLRPRTGWIRLMDENRIKRHRKEPNKAIIVPCNGHTYSFRPNVKGHYVAEVPFADDYTSILSIGAGYEPYGRETHIDPEDLPPPSKIPTMREGPNLAAENGANPEPKPRGPKKPATPRPGAPAVDPAAG